MGKDTSQLSEDEVSDHACCCLRGVCSCFLVARDARLAEDGGLICSSLDWREGTAEVWYSGFIGCGVAIAMLVIINK